MAKFLSDMDLRRGCVRNSSQQRTSINPLSKGVRRQRLGLVLPRHPLLSLVRKNQSVVIVRRLYDNYLQTASVLSSSCLIPRGYCRSELDLCARISSLHANCGALSADGYFQAREVSGSGPIGRCVSVVVGDEESFAEDGLALAMRIFASRSVDSSATRAHIFSGPCGRPAHSSPAASVVGALVLGQ